MSNRLESQSWRHGPQKGNLALKSQWSGIGSCPGTARRRNLELCNWKNTCLLTWWHFFHGPGTRRTPHTCQLSLRNLISYSKCNIFWGENNADPTCWTPRSCEGIQYEALYFILDVPSAMGTQRKICMGGEYIWQFGKETDLGFCRRLVMRVATWHMPWSLNDTA